MQIVSHFIRKYPLSLFCIAMVWVLSLVPFFPETPLDDIACIDKWTHVAMYGGMCSVIWWEYLHRHQSLDYEKLFFYAWLMPILMSGLLELLQEYCTAGHRNGDWLDFGANAIGVTVAVAVGLVLSYFHCR